MDYRFTIIGALTIGVGLTISILFWNLATTGDIEDFLPNRMIVQLGGIIAGLGLLLLIVSFGLYKKRRRMFR